jgi:mycothiol synthase
MGDDSVRTLEAGDEAGVRDVMESAFPVDRMPGIARSEIERFLRRMVADPEGTVVALEGERVVGYCTPRHDDLTVHPQFRRRGHGRRLVPAAVEIERSRGHDELRLHVPLHLPGSIAFARAVGLRYRSSLWQFRLSADHPVPPPTFPDDVVVRPWDVEHDSDFEAWATFLTASFEGHPTPLHPKPSVIAAIHAEPDFDPTEILLVSPTADPAAVIAFARIEMITDDPAVPTGEVGLIGVLPEWRNRGLGRELLRWSVTELRRRGAGPIELAVEAANERATRLYRGHGFEPAVEWPHWVLPIR